MGETDVLSMLTDKRLDFYYKLHVLLKLNVLGGQVQYMNLLQKVVRNNKQCPLTFSYLMSNRFKAEW